MVQGFEYRREVVRKLIHLSSLWMVAAIWFLPRAEALVVFAACLVLGSLFEILRIKGVRVAQAFNGLLREKERARPSGAIYVSLAAFIVTFFCAREVAAAAMTVMLVGDAFAALVGRRFGRVKLADGKTLEGALAFFVAGGAGAFVFVPLVPALAAAIAAAVTELFARRLRLDDNLSVPLVAALVLYFLM